MFAPALETEKLEATTGPRRRRLKISTFVAICQSLTAAIPLCSGKED